MQENENDTEVVKSEEEIVLEDSTDETSSNESLKEVLARLKRAEAKIEKMKLDAKVEKKVEVELEKKAGELDNADYALLATKGIDDDDPRIDFLKEKMAKWNMPLRELLKDEDIKAKLRSMKIEGDVRQATPSSTKRSSAGDMDREDYFYQKYLSEDKLPNNLPPGMAERLVNRRYQQTDPRANPFE